MIPENPIAHTDHRPKYAEVYYETAPRISADWRSKEVLPIENAAHLKRRELGDDRTPPAQTNPSPSPVAIATHVGFAVQETVAITVPFLREVRSPVTFSRIPPSGPKRVLDEQRHDNAKLKSEAYELALKIRRAKERQLLMKAGLVETIDGEIENIEAEIITHAQRLDEIAGASPVISAFVKKRAYPLTEISDAYRGLAELFMQKRALQEKFYQAQSDRQKRNLQKHINRIDAELAAIFTVITQNQETVQNGGGGKNPHESEKRFREIGRRIDEIRLDLRLVSRKLMLFDAPKKADELRQTLRVLSSEQEGLARPRRMRLAQIKKENGRRGEMRKNKACPEYWDGDGLKDGDIEERIVRADYEAERMAASLAQLSA